MSRDSHKHVYNYIYRQCCSLTRILQLHQLCTKLVITNWIYLLQKRGIHQCQQPKNSQLPSKVREIINGKHNIVTRIHSNVAKSSITLSINTNLPKATNHFKDFQQPPSFSRTFKPLNLHHFWIQAVLRTFKDQGVPCTLNVLSAPAVAWERRKMQTALHCAAHSPIPKAVGILRHVHISNASNSFYTL